MEHLPLNIENIKMSIYHISKYILNKSVERGKINNFDDLNSISKVAWKFIFTFYDSEWDILHIENKVSFRNKVAFKFIPKTSNVPKSKNTKTTEKLASVSSLPSPICHGTLRH